MKPIEAVRALADVATLIAHGQPLPPSLRAWIAPALLRRARDPGTDLERLLGTRSRAGGRLNGHSRLPDRDAAIRRYAEQIPGTVAEQARELSKRVKAHRTRPNPDLSEIEQFGRLPASVPQLDRILRGTTAAANIK